MIFSLVDYDVRFPIQINLQNDEIGVLRSSCEKRVTVCRPVHVPEGPCTACLARSAHSAPAPTESPPGSVVQFQLVQRAAAIKEAGAAAVAAELANTDDSVILIEHHAVIGDRAVLIAAGCWIRCTESVQNLEVTVRPDAVNDTVAVHPPERSRRVQRPIFPKSQPGIWKRPVPILTGGVYAAEVVHNLNDAGFQEGKAEHDAIAICSTVEAAP